MNRTLSRKGHHSHIESVKFLTALTSTGASLPVRQDQSILATGASLPVQHRDKGICDGHHCTRQIASAMSSRPSVPLPYYVSWNVHQIARSFSSFSCLRYCGSIPRRVALKPRLNLRQRALRTERLAKVSVRCTRQQMCECKPAEESTRCPFMSGLESQGGKPRNP